MCAPWSWWAEIKTRVSGLLKKALGSRNISLAKPEIVKEVTGYVIGSIPPFHWQARWVSLHSGGFFDEGSSARSRCRACGGNEILITPENLVIASHAKVINLTEREEAAT